MKKIAFIFVLAMACAASFRAQIVLKTKMDHLVPNGTDSLGSIILSITGGTAPYVYAWDKGAYPVNKDRSETPKNSYTVKVKGTGTDSVSYYYNLGYKVRWGSFNGTIERNDSLKKQGTASGNPTARSINMLRPNTDGWAELILGPLVNTYMVGFLDSASVTGPGSYLDIDFGFQLTGANALYGWNGGSFTLLGSATVGDVIQIKRVGSVYSLLKNNSSLYTKSTGTTKSIMVKAFIPNDAIVNLGASFADSSTTSSIRVNALVDHFKTDGLDGEGGISLSVSGGNSPYTYKWLPGGATNRDQAHAAKNAYTLTVKDAKNDSVKYYYNLGSKIAWTNFHNAQLRNDSLISDGSSIAGGTYRSAVSDNFLKKNTAGWAEWITRSSSGGYYLGFLDSAYASAYNTYTDIDFGFQMTSGNDLYAYSGGSSTYLSHANIGDVITIGRTSTQFYLKKNNTTVFTSSSPLYTKSLKVKALLVSDPFINTGSSFNPSLTVDYKQATILPARPTAGYILLTPKGGTPPYAYKWNNASTEKNLTGIGSGVYSATVTDADQDTVRLSVTLGSELRFVNMTNLTVNADGEYIKTDIEKSAMANTNTFIRAGAPGFYQFTLKDINTNFNFVFNPYDTVAGLQAQVPIIVRQTTVSIARSTLPAPGTSDYAKINFADTITTGTYAHVIQKEFISDTCTVSCSRLTLSGVQFDYGQLYVFSSGVTIQKGITVANNASLKFSKSGTTFTVYRDDISISASPITDIVLTGILVPRTPRTLPGTGSQGPANGGNTNPPTSEGCVTCAGDVTRNFTESSIYDEQGGILSQSRTYTDNLGRLLQTQVRNVAEKNILATQTLYDAYGRAVGVSLPAPVCQSCFCFQSNFMRPWSSSSPYTYNDFDTPNYTANSSVISSGERDNPKFLNVGTLGTLGWYYSNNNTLEKYVAIANTPYSRIQYSSVDPSSVLKASQPGNKLNSGSGHESYNFKMATMGELNQMFGAGLGWRVDAFTDFYSTDPCANILQPVPLENTAPLSLKSISRDENGIENVTFYDLSGNVIATCMAGQVNGFDKKTEAVKSWLSFTDESKRYIDIHLPDGCENSVTISPPLPNAYSSAPYPKYNIIDLKTGEYVKFSGSIDLVATNNISLQPALPAGYYRIVLKEVNPLYILNYNPIIDPDRGVVVTQNLNYYNFSLNYYDYANRLKATVSPKGFDDEYSYSSTSAYSNYFRPVKSITTSANTPSFYPSGKSWSLDNSTFVNTMPLSFSTVAANSSKNMRLKITFDGIAPSARGEYPGGSYGDSRITQNTTSSANYDYPEYPQDTTKRRSVIPADTVILSNTDVTFKVKIALLDAADHVIDSTTKQSFDLRCTVSYRRDSTQYTSWHPATFTYEQRLSNTTEYTTAVNWAKVKIIQIDPTSPSLGNNLRLYENVLKDLDIGYSGYEGTPSSTPQHKMVERYRYNSLSQVLSTVSPDEGQTDYVYSNNGKPKYTQNALQDASDANVLYRKFTYVWYDDNDRPINSGEYLPSSGISGNKYFFQSYEERTANPTPSLPAFSVFDIPENYQAYYNLPANAGDQVNMVYDRYDPQFYVETGSLSQTIFVQRHLAGRLAYSYNTNKKTWYSYDEEGRLEWLVQKYYGVNPTGAGADVVKTYNYKYDVAGNVTEVDYDVNDATDKFYHYYEYDQNYNLKRVYTSRNGTTKVLQAKYNYYLHGPLKRAELGNKLQGNDYVYTINGWLKAMNGPEMAKEYDAGKDGYLTPGSTATAYKDLFGMNLDYYLDDYERENTRIESYDDSQNTFPLAPDQFNGIIKGLRWQTRMPSGYSVLSYPNQHLMYGYQYDKKYQLVDANFATITANSTQNLPILVSMAPAIMASSKKSDYRVFNLSYDYNGNILTLTRRAYAAGPNGINMDDMTYNYVSCTNKLSKVTDAVSGNPFNTLGFTPGQANNNYQYDAVGELTSDATNNKKYEYNGGGNISVIRDAANNLVAAYDYDEQGYRIKKTAYLAANMKKYTWYVRDPEGNIVTCFEKTATGNTTSFGAPTEWNVYGDSRLGTLDNTGGVENYIYELSDHLGNVRTTLKKWNKTTMACDFSGNGVDDNWFYDNGTLDNSLNSGNYCVKTQQPNTAFGAGTKMIPIKNGNSVYIAWKTYYQTGAVPNAGMVVQLTDAAGNILPNCWQFFALGGSANSWQNQNTTYVVTANYPDMYLMVYPWNQDNSNKAAWFDDISVAFNSGGVDAPDQLNLAAYYPQGSVMPGLNYNSSYNYKYGYQGQFAEKDDESNENFFELRNYDPLLARFKTTDPYGQFHSPYLAMGNSHPNGVDPDGGNWYGFRLGFTTAFAVSVIAELAVDYYGQGDHKINNSLASYAELAIGSGLVAGTALGGIFDVGPNNARFNLFNHGPFTVKKREFNAIAIHFDATRFFKASIDKKWKPWVFTLQIGAPVDITRWEDQDIDFTNSNGGFRFDFTANKNTRFRYFGLVNINNASMSKEGSFRFGGFSMKGGIPGFWLAGGKHASGHVSIWQASGLKSFRLQKKHVVGQRWGYFRVKIIQK